MEETKELKHNLQKCYIWLNDETVTEPLAIVNGCYFPVINEQMILWDSVELFQKYRCVNRIFGINKESQTIVLNIYVEKIIEEANDKN
jgi:hypothetical protein